MYTNSDNDPKHTNGVQLCYKFWMNNCKGEYAISDRRIKLLIDIHELGSLAAAAKNREMSYRKAWGDLNEAEEKLGFALIDKHRGGLDGGTTVLTERGKIMVAAYKEFCRDFDEKMDEAMVKFKNTMKQLDDLSLYFDLKETSPKPCSDQNPTDTFFKSDTTQQHKTDTE